MNDAIFYAKLKYLVGTDSKQIHLAEIMAGDWEIVCQSSGYDESVFVKKHNRFYGPVGYPDDRRWGLIFISPDGSYKYIRGGVVTIGFHGCAEKNNAIIYKHNGSTAYYLPDEAKIKNAKY